MQIFGTNFLKVKNNYILPLINYGITRPKYSHWSFKDIITNNVISLKKNVGKSVEIELSPDDFYKALHCDIELFTNKAIIQYVEYRKSILNSPSWSYVTLYYFSFFTITCFFRLLHRGFVFLNSEQIKRLENYSILVNSEIISLDTGNYYFNVKEVNQFGNVILNLTHRGDNVHKSNWIQLETTLRSFLPNCDKDELLIYKLQLAFISKYKPEYPSTLRNHLNYTAESSILDFEQAIPIIDLGKINSNFVDGLFKLKTDDTVKCKMEAASYLTSFIHQFNIELYNEYLLRSNFGKDFRFEREKYLKVNRMSLT